MAKRRTTTEPDTELAAIDAGLLGPIPDSWPVVRLSEVTYEGTDRNGKLTATRDDVLGVDNQRGLLPSDRLLGDDFSRYKFVRRGEFAYNPMRLNVGSIGLSAYDKPGLVSPDYIVFGCNCERLDPDYLDLFRMADGWKTQIRLSGAGSIRIRYYYRDIAKFVIPLPPLAEQREIAHVLRAVQRAKEAAEAVVAAARQLKRSLLRHLFTYGPVPVEEADRVPLKETGIGPIPEHWELIQLGDCAQLATGGTPSRDQPAYWNGSIPWVKTGEVNYSTITSAEEHITTDGMENSNARLFPAGTLLVAMYGQGVTR
jgi:type I restriction enzyme S subunit